MGLKTPFSNPLEFSKGDFSEVTDGSGSVEFKGFLNSGFSKTDSSFTPIFGRKLFKTSVSFAT